MAFILILNYDSVVINIIFSQTGKLTLIVNRTTNLNNISQMYIFTQLLLAWAVCDTRSVFLAEFNRFEFRVFFLLDRLLCQG